MTLAVGVSVIEVIGTGFRDQEVRVAEYKDVDFAEGVIRVREKKEWNFKPKSKEIRDVPLGNT